MKDTDAAVISVHPLFGPMEDKIEQNFILLIYYRT